MPICGAVLLKPDGRREVLGTILYETIPLCFCGALTRQTILNKDMLSGICDTLGIKTHIAFLRQRAGPETCDARPINKFASDVVRCLSHNLSYLEEKDAEVRGDAIISFEPINARVTILKLIDITMSMIDAMLKVRLDMEDQARLDLKRRMQQPLPDDSKDEQDGTVSLVDFKAGEDLEKHFTDHFPFLTQLEGLDMVSDWVLCAPQSPFWHAEVVGRVVHVQFPRFACIRSILFGQHDFIPDGKISCRFITVEDLRTYFLPDMDDTEFKLSRECLRLGGTYWTVNFQDRDVHNVLYLGGWMMYIEDEELCAAFHRLKSNRALSKKQ